MVSTPFSTCVRGVLPHRDADAGYLQGINSVGTAVGSLMALNQFFIELARWADSLNDYFGERPSRSSPVQPGQTTGIGFWNNRNGQALLKSLNGGATSKQLGNWLATTLPNRYAGLAGKTKSEVAPIRQSRFGIKVQKLDAQVLATAPAVYVTNASLAGTAAVPYGFLVTAGGVGAATFNVGARGEAFGVADGTALAVLDLLRATDLRPREGVLDQDPEDWGYALIAIASRACPCLPERVRGPRRVRGRGCPRGG
jgi:hypothetical protein